MPRNGTPSAMRRRMTSVWPSSSSGGRGIGERAHARQDDGVGGDYLSGIVGDAGIGSGGAQAALDG